MRELVAMSESRVRERWTHTACLLAMLANVHRDPKKGRLFKPSDFDPFEQERNNQSPIPVADLSVLKSVFVDHGKEAAR